MNPCRKPPIFYWLIIVTITACHDRKSQTGVLGQNHQYSVSHYFMRKNLVNYGSHKQKYLKKTIGGMKVSIVYITPATTGSHKQELLEKAINILPVTIICVAHFVSDRSHKQEWQYILILYVGVYPTAIHY